MKSLVRPAVVCLSFVAVNLVPAQATPITVSFSAHVEQIASNFSVGTGSIAIGDVVTGYLSFDTSLAVPSAPFISDPNVHVYKPPIAFGIFFPQYSYEGNDPGIVSGIVVNNDSQICPTCGLPYDGIGFAQIGFASAPTAPFALGSGNAVQYLNLNAFDFTGAALTSDLLPDAPNFDNLGSRLLEFDLFNVDSQRLVQVQAFNVAITTRASSVQIPEAPTWLFLVAGLVLACGAGLLRRPVPLPTARNDLTAIAGMRSARETSPDLTISESSKR